MLKKLALLAAPLLLAACQTTTPTAVIDTSCMAMEPITYSRRDTTETVPKSGSTTPRSRFYVEGNNTKNPLFGPQVRFRPEYSIAYRIPKAEY